MSISVNYAEVKARMEAACARAGRDPKEVTLIAVSKTKPVSMLTEAYEAGARDFGENKVQELLSKQDGIIDVHHHFIGHLQTNKVKDIIDKVELIHSVSSLKLAKEISKVSIKKNVVSNILLEVNIGNEESKSGFSAEEILPLAENFSSFPNIRLRGLMAIPPISQNSGDNRKFFQKAEISLFSRLLIH